MFQLNLHFLNNRDTLIEHLEKETGKSVSLAVTDNSTSMLSLRPQGKSVSVRLHWMFLDAGPDVVSEIASFIKNSLI